MTIIPVQYKQVLYHGTILTVPYDTKWLAIDPTGCVTAFDSKPEIYGNDWHQDNAIAVVGTVVAASIVEEIESLGGWQGTAVQITGDTK